MKNKHCPRTRKKKNARNLSQLGISFFPPVALFFFSAPFYLEVAVGKCFGLDAGYCFFKLWPTRLVCVVKNSIGKEGIYQSEGVVVGILQTHFSCEAKSSEIGESKKPKLMP